VKSHGERLFLGKVASFYHQTTFFCHDFGRGPFYGSTPLIIYIVSLLVKNAN
jgi:hypothetical protein